MRYNRALAIAQGTDVSPAVIQSTGAVVPLREPGRMSGPELRAALRELGMLQGEFAVYTGHRPDSVSRWCTGRKPVPPHVSSWLMLARLAVAGGARFERLPSRARRSGA